MINKQGIRVVACNKCKVYIQIDPDDLENLNRINYFQNVTHAKHTRVIGKIEEFEGYVDVT